jgi:hypothetical protein
MSENYGEFLEFLKKNSNGQIYDDGAQVYYQLNEDGLLGLHDIPNYLTRVRMSEDNYLKALKIIELEKEDDDKYIELFANDFYYKFVDMHKIIDMVNEGCDPEIDYVDFEGYGYKTIEDIFAEIGHNLEFTNWEDMSEAELDAWQTVLRHII